MTVSVQVLFFSVLRDITGLPEMALDLPAGSTVAQLLHTLYERWPALAGWDGSLLVAVNQTYVKREATIPDRAEVAVMPPVQGG